MPTSPLYQPLDSVAADTLYGVEYEELIPVRHVDVVAKPKLTEKQFFTPSALADKVEGWQIIVLLISIIIVGLVKAFSNNRYYLGLKALLSYTTTQEVVREEKVFFHRSNILLMITYILTLSLFLFEVNKFVQKRVLEITDVSFFLMIIGFVIVVYSVKYMFSKILSFIFDDAKIASEYIFNVSIYNNLFGVFLIPIVCIIYFTTIPMFQLLLYVVLPVGTFLFLLRLFRVFLMGKTRGLLYVYIFLYICTLEILPLVVLYWIFVHK